MILLIHSLNILLENSKAFSWYCKNIFCLSSNEFIHGAGKKYGLVFQCVSKVWFQYHYLIVQNKKFRPAKGVVIDMQGTYFLEENNLFCKYEGSFHLCSQIIEQCNSLIYTFNFFFLFFSFFYQQYFSSNSWNKLKVSWSVFNYEFWRCIRGLLFLAEMQV